MTQYQLFGALVKTNTAFTTIRPSPPQPDAALTIEVERRDKPPWDDAWQSRYQLAFATNPEKPFISVSQNDRGYRLRIHDRADFYVTINGTSIWCVPTGDTPWATAEQLLIDQVLPRALQLWGRPSLHASAVTNDGGAIAFIGEAGSGKSTLTATLCERGFQLLCDDCLALQFTPSEVNVFPGYPSVRLWPDSAEALLGQTHNLPTASPRTTKLRRALPLSGTQPLRCIFALHPNSEEVSQRAPVAAQQLRGRDAFTMLMTSLHRLAPDPTAALGAEFDALSRLAADTPVYALHYRQDYAHLEALVAQVIATAAES